MRDLDRQNIADEYKIRNLINKLYAGFVIILSISIFSLGIYRNDPPYYLFLVMLNPTLLLISLYLANKSIRLGLYLTCFFSFFIVLSMTILTPSHRSDFITLGYGLAILIASNELGARGFFAGALYISMLVLGTNFLFPANIYPHQILSTIVNSVLIGCIPLLLQANYIKLVHAEEEEKKVEALAIQNEEILNSLEKIFRNKDKSATQFKFEHLDAQESIYNSPYSEAFDSK